MAYEIRDNKVSFGLTDSEFKMLLDESGDLGHDTAARILLSKILTLRQKERELTALKRDLLTLPVSVTDD